MVFSVRGISKEYEHRLVLASVNLGLNSGDKIALVGSNGSGKSTLLRILAGQETPDEGTVTHSTSDEIGYLPQFVRTVEGDTIGDVITCSVAGLKSLELRMRELEQRMTDFVEDTVLNEYGEISAHFEARGGYDIDSRTDEILANLGVGYLTRDRKVSGLSGGEKARVGMAALLLAAPDLLLLDEPTNDLDDRALAWLEGYLKRYRGGVLFVTHDRDFVDAVATAILELDEHTHGLTRYEGNYGRYLVAKRAARISEQQAYDTQQEEISQLRDQAATTARAVGFGRASTDHDKRAYNFRGAGAERAVSRNVRAVKEKLERIEAHLLQPPPKPLRFHARFSGGRLRPGTVAVQAHKLVMRYGERIILDRVDCLLEADDRVCLIGPNGSGKTTLLRILASEAEPQAGDLQWSPGVRIGYLPQEPHFPEPAETVAANVTIGLRRAGLSSVTDEARGWLVRWGLLTREDLTKRVADLSLGQQRKVELGILIGSEPDVLLLDEPTNHVTFDVIESLQAALIDFEGPVLIATHDRRLIREFPRRLWRLHEGQLAEVDRSGGTAV